jgi:DNA polymerase-3 subunit epsilon
MAWCDSPLVGLDFETTGVDPLSDLPVQVAIVWSDGRGNDATAAWLIDPEREIPEEAQAVHGISTERARSEGRSLTWTAQEIHRQLDTAARENVPVVAMNASFDATIAECLFERAGLPSLSWRLVIDPLVIDRQMDRFRRGKRRLDALCELYGITLEGAHDAGHDAVAAVALARAIGRRWPEAAGFDPEELTVLQRAWHGEWARNFDDWCQRDGRPGLSPGEYRWPVRRDLRPDTGRTTASLRPSVRSAARPRSGQHHVQLELPFSTPTPRAASPAPSPIDERDLVAASRIAVLP